MHLVSWQRICTPKAWGGLGLRSTRNVNQASLMKAGWQLIHQREDMWVKVIRMKYKCGRDIFPKIQYSLPGSNFWKCISHVWKHIKPNLQWRVGSGRDINCWNDTWLTSGAKLIEQITRPLRDTEKFLRVCELVNFDGDWDLTCIARLLPEDIKNRILRMNPPSNDVTNRVAQSLTTDGLFSNSSAYEHLLDPTFKSTYKIFQTIWRWSGLQCGRLHLLKMAVGAIMTYETRMRRGISEAATCPMCGMGDETLMHLFRDCATTNDT